MTPLSSASLRLPHRVLPTTHALLAALLVVACGAREDEGGAPATPSSGTPTAGATSTTASSSPGAGGQPGNAPTASAGGPIDGPQGAATGGTHGGGAAVGTAGEAAGGMAGAADEGPVEPPIESCAPLELPLPLWECPPGPYEALPLIEAEEETVLCTDEVNWGEGPLWSASDQTLYFSSFDERDEAGLFNGSLLTFREGEGCVELFTEIGTNGLAPGPAGFLIAGRQSNRTLSLVELSTGRVCSLADKFQGSRFSSPNDVAVRSDGNLYFTDPAWNLGERPEELPQSLYRIDPGGELTLVDVFAEQRPNGVSLSPNGDLLYVAILGSVQVYDVDAAGTPSNRREFISGPNVDGMAIDCAGNVFLSTGDVYSPEGELIGEFWGGTNVAFGGPDGKTLFIAGHGRLTSRPVTIPGLPY